jgi:branched-chain amino acid transport system ATP-binding protein
VAAVTLLATEALSRHFGGVKAVDGVDFALDRGEIRAIIGPNGAGKTTLVGMICGRIDPSRGRGRVRFEDRDITGLSAWARVQRGIAYTFQITSVFGGLTCFDNVALAAQRRVHGHRALDREVAHLLGRVGLADRAGVVAGVLPYGHQRLLEIALGLALKPKLLILDEPTQGLTDSEIDHFCALIREVAAEATVLLIEHNMAVVMELADRITVMNNGRVLAEGTPDEIRRDAQVQEAYLGA